MDSHGDACHLVPAVGAAPRNGSRPVAVRAWVGRHPFLTFIGLTYAYSWSCWLLAGIGGNMIPFLTGGLGPMIAAGVVIRVTGGSPRAWRGPSGGGGSVSGGGPTPSDSRRCCTAWSPSHCRSPAPPGGRPGPACLRTQPHSEITRASAMRSVPRIGSSPNVESGSAAGPGPADPARRPVANRQPSATSSTASGRSRLACPAGRSVITDARNRSRPILDRAALGRGGSPVPAPAALDTGLRPGLTQKSAGAMARATTDGRLP